MENASISQNINIYFLTKSEITGPETKIVKLLKRLESVSPQFKVMSLSFIFLQILRAATLVKRRKNTRGKYELWAKEPWKSSFDQEPFWSHRSSSGRAPMLHAPTLDKKGFTNHSSVGAHIDLIK